MALINQENPSNISQLLEAQAPSQLPIALTISAHSFPLFPLLPPELRHTIWTHAAFNTLVIYETHVLPHPPIKEAQIDYYRWIRLMLTCRASHDVARLLDQDSFGRTSRQFEWEMQERWGRVLRGERAKLKGEGKGEGGGEGQVEGEGEEEGVAEGKAQDRDPDVRVLTGEARYGFFLPRGWNGDVRMPGFLTGQDNWVDVGK